LHKSFRTDQPEEIAMLRCAILDDYQSCALGFADWGSLHGVTVDSIPDAITTVESLVERLAGYQILVAMRERTRFDAALFERLPHLRLLITTGMWNTAIDLQTAAARGVTVCGTRGVPYPAPELAWALLLSLARHISAEVASLRAGHRWQTQIGVGLCGKTIGIVGLGRIGSRIARYAQAFEMPVIAWSPHLSDERCKSVGVKRASSLDDLLQRADVVTLHMVLAQSTWGMIGARELALLKPSALLVNTSRGPLIDETALIQTLSENRIGGAALDVYDTEPLPLEHPFRRLSNVVATPHIGYVTRENYPIFYTDAVEDIQAWLKSSPVRVLSKAK
jgi:phosphoglycerate dehydrogenase-like enzyme